MTETVKHLIGDFVVLDLGSAHSQGLVKSLPSLSEAVTLVEIDALGSSERKDSSFHKRVSLKKAVSKSSGIRMFTRRKFPDCSSFLTPKAELIKAYGLEKYFEKVDSIELECDTIHNLLTEAQIKHVDFFKTDLEGMDFEVLSSAPEIVGNALCVQSEVRFQPFYEGEAHFHEISQYLTGLDFELVLLRPELWKYATPKCGAARDGRVVWADAIFFLGSQAVQKKFGTLAWKAFLKQIILAKMLGLHNFAEQIFEATSNQFPEAVRMEMQQFVPPRFNLPKFLLHQINAMPFGWIAIGGLRRIFSSCYRTTCVYRDKMVATH